LRTKRTRLKQSKKKGSEKKRKKAEEAAAAAEAADTDTVSPAASPKKKKSKKVLAVEDDTIEDDSSVGKKQISLRVPGQIKKCLIIDWENITRNKMLCELPRNNTVSALLQEFLTSKNRTPDNADIMTEVINGLKQYFERALPFLLLYRFERPQYEEWHAKKNNKETVCDLYGPEHLARLFVKLPELLSHTQMMTSEMTLLQAKLVEFLRWFAKHPHYFNLNYKTTTREYQQLVISTPETAE